MNAYIVFYGTKNTKIYANTSYAAHQKGVDFFRVPDKKHHLLSVHPAETKEGQAVTQAAA